MERSRLWAGEKRLYERQFYAVLRRRTRVLDIPPEEQELGYTSSDGMVHLAYSHPVMEPLEENSRAMFRYGVFIHETLHQVYTDFAYCAEAAGRHRDPQEQQAVALFANLVEDPAIEYRAPEVFGGEALDALRFTVRRIWSASPPLEEAESPFRQLVNALVMFGDLGLLKGSFSFPEAKEAFCKIAPEFNEAVEDPDPRARIDAAERWAVLTRKLWKKEESMEEAMQGLRSAPMEGDGSPEQGASGKAPKGTPESDRRREFAKALKEAAEEKAGGGKASQGQDAQDAHEAHDAEDAQDAQEVPGGQEPQDGKETRETAGSEGAPEESGAQEGQDAQDAPGSGDRDDADGPDEASGKDGKPGTGGKSGSDGQQPSGRDAQGAQDGQEVQDAHVVQNVHDVHDAQDAHEVLQAQDATSRDRGGTSRTGQPQGTPDGVLGRYSDPAIQDGTGITAPETAEDFWERVEAEAAGLQEEDADTLDLPVPLPKADGSRAGAVTCLNLRMEAAKGAEEAYRELLKQTRHDTQLLTASLKRILQNDLDERLRATSGKYNIKRGLTGTSVRVFDKKRGKRNIDDLAVLLLVDISGSMYGRKIALARNAAVMLAETFAALHIPCCIMGFTADTAGADVVHCHYVTWKNTPGERLALTGIQATANNDDGYSVRYATQALLRRRAEHRLLFVLSDGAPACNRYKRVSGIHDTALAIRDAKKAAGVFGIGIGIPERHCQELKGMYQGAFLNVERLSDLSATLAQQLKRVIRRI